MVNSCETDKFRILKQRIFLKIKVTIHGSLIDIKWYQNGYLQIFGTPHTKKFKSYENCIDFLFIEFHLDYESWKTFFV